jgi:hypothetical protein
MKISIPIVFKVLLGAFLIHATAQAATNPSPTPSTAPDPTAAGDYGRRLFQRLAGAPLLPSDPRFAAYNQLIVKGDLKGAAAVATSDDGFYNVTVRDWAAVMANKDGTPLIDLDDFQATVIGAARDNLDARTLLTGNYSYVADPSANIQPPTLSDNNHYASIDAAQLNLRKVLIKQEPQWPGTTMESAGLLTSRSWGKMYFSAGTNRRSVAFSMQIFLCSPIATWRNVAIDDYHVRRDVNRVPGGDPRTFQTTCRGCHGPMDAFGGAFAHFDFDVVATQLNYLGPNTVAPKFNQNANTYPDGWITTDDSWVNMLADNPQFGWRTPPTGSGINEFGELLSHSEQFGRCMATRAFKEVCRRNATNSEQDLIQTLAIQFETEGYHLQTLFQEVATSPECLGTP